jgi:excinuclease UvrABC helicase subunit UvrB
MKQVVFVSATPSVFEIEHSMELSGGVILGLDPGISSKVRQVKNTKDTEILKNNVSNDVSISSSELIDSGSSPE